MPDPGQDNFIIGPENLILITGASGFIGRRLVGRLLELGFHNLRCITRNGAAAAVRDLTRHNHHEAQVEVVEGNLLSRADCVAATQGATLIFHLAAGRGQKSFADAYLNSVVTTRNLLEACVGNRGLRRLLNVSSFSVYSNMNKSRLLDESSPLEDQPELRGEAYSFAKVKQDRFVTEYARQFAIPYVTIRPGFVYGPGNEAITGRVGINPFGLFLHLGGSNPLPLTYVDNCVDAMALAGLKSGIEGEVFNVVDDDLPSSRRFLRLYKQNVRRFKSVYVPHWVSYALCGLWETYSAWSERQLPPTYNRRGWHAFWKKTRYTNQKLKARLGWRPRVPTGEALQRYFEACRNRSADA